MTDKQFEDRCDVLAKLLTAINPNASIAGLAQDLIKLRGEISEMRSGVSEVRIGLAEVKKQLANIESSIRAVKTLVG